LRSFKLQYSKDDNRKPSKHVYIILFVLFMSRLKLIWQVPGLLWTKFLNIVLLWAMRAWMGKYK